MLVLERNNHLAGEGGSGDQKREECVQKGKVRLSTDDGGGSRVIRAGSTGV